MTDLPYHHIPYDQNHKKICKDTPKDTLNDYEEFF
jgi:hypothetical protein